MVGTASFVADVCEGFVSHWNGMDTNGNSLGSFAAGSARCVGDAGVADTGFDVDAGAGAHD